MGESVAEATITKMVVDAGSAVEPRPTHCEIANGQGGLGSAGPEDGTLVEWCVAEGDVVQVGQSLHVTMSGEASAEPAPPAPQAKASAEIAETQSLKWWLRPWPARRGALAKGTIGWFTRHWFAALP